jgi:hypothetical protein
MCNATAMPKIQSEDVEDAFAPTGWAIVCHAGWPGESSPPPVRVGNSMVPTTFHIAVMPDKAIAGPNVLIDLCYRAQDGDVILSLVGAHGIEVPQGLDIVRKERPMEWWKRHVFLDMVYLLAREAIGGPQPGGPRDAAAVWDRAMDAKMDAARSAPISPRRNRLTVGHLAKVAEVYRQAWQDGEPPTKAVAHKFSVSHSTAARWVGAAREAHHLGPADGSRGGELPAAKRSTKEAKS